MPCLSACRCNVLCVCCLSGVVCCCPSMLLACRWRATLWAGGGGASLGGRSVELSSADPDGHWLQVGRPPTPGTPNQHYQPGCFCFFDDCHTRAILGPSHRERLTCSAVSNTGHCVLILSLSVVLCGPVHPGFECPGLGGQCVWLLDAPVVLPAKAAGLGRWKVLSLLSLSVCCLLLLAVACIYFVSF